MIQQLGSSSSKKIYRAPALLVHGSIESLTESGTGHRVEKHPMDFKKGSKIRPR
jgi:hypothetical protein